ncbi:MAG: hypothetical protein HOI23_09450 [Deltaproteobacteria bacterium]|jgi:hypothetical protein|nr:hypothetical protein [Deltaproteobacteria bacterium]MBT6434237.1 hypothetical protein [Deltaproteobacteria bacterium]MBT6488487.1 hypothetical protein [Deltaproteobacteria bacterium]
MKTLFKVCWILVALGCITGCASHTNIPSHVRMAIEDFHGGRVMELRQSCYYGDLYEDTGKWLLSPHAFESVHHIVDLDGKPIHPSGQRGIVPAGTRFLIEKIEFPDIYAMTTRMLSSPRYHTWVYLRALEKLPLESEKRSHFVMLLPMDLQDREDVESNIAKLLAPEGDVSRWLKQRRPSVRVAIAHKDLKTGMTRDELVAARGEPHLWIAQQGSYGLEMVAWYPSHEAWIRNGRIIDVKPGRSIQKRKPRKPGSP